MLIRAVPLAHGLRNTFTDLCTPWWCHTNHCSLTHLPCTHLYATHRHPCLFFFFCKEGDDSGTLADFRELKEQISAIKVDVRANKAAIARHDYTLQAQEVSFGQLQLDVAALGELKQTVNTFYQKQPDGCKPGDFKLSKHVLTFLTKDGYTPTTTDGIYALLPEQVRAMWKVKDINRVLQTLKDKISECGIVMEMHAPNGTATLAGTVPAGSVAVWRIDM